MATGKMSRANSTSGEATTSSACGSRRLASAMSVCTPAMVALAARPATASATISTPDKAQRSRSTGWRMRRSSWSSTSISPGCGAVMHLPSVSRVAGLQPLGQQDFDPFTRAGRYASRDDPTVPTARLDG